MPTLMDVANLLADLDRSTKNLVQALTDFPIVDFNKKPSDEAWSAGDVAEHLYKIEKAVARLLSGDGIPTEHRPPDQKVAIMASAFPQRDLKYPAPDFFEPGPEPKDPATMTHLIQGNRGQLAQLIPGLELSLTCFSFPHPFLGKLTKWEWAYFVIHHSARHLAQLAEIKQQIRRATP